MRQPGVTEVVDKMIDAAVKHRNKLKQSFDDPIHAEVSAPLYSQMQAWGATDYLDIAYNIRVKPKGH